jgi:hypothetical protein
MFLDFCITQVVVRSDGYMIFSISQTLHNIPFYIRVTKNSDETNINMYLLDNLGNRYDHVQVGGQALERILMSSDKTVFGYFTFPPARKGVTSFAFWDDDNHIAVEDIVLVIYPINQVELTLKWHALALDYNTDLWKPGQTTDGGEFLTHVRLPGCQVMESQSTEVKGTIKNNALVLGKTTYQLYGYIEDGKDYAVREYLAISGLPGVDVQNPVLLQVVIPLNNSQSCIQAASNLLSSLRALNK